MGNVHICVMYTVHVCAGSNYQTHLGDMIVSHSQCIPVTSSNMAIMYVISLSVTSLVMSTNKDDTADIISFTICAQECRLTVCTCTVYYNDCLMLWLASLHHRVAC